MAKTAYTTSQIVTQLTTSWGGSLTGYTFRWSSSLPTISYSINTSTPSNVPGYVPPEGGQYLVKMDALQVATASLAFQLWDDLIAKSQGAQHRLVQTVSPSANITLDYSSNTSNATYSRAFGSVNSATHKVTISAEQVWLSSNWVSNGDSGMSPGAYGLLTMVHEIGHTLGLSHPGVYNAGSGGAITYANNAVFAQDNRQYTVMSYFGGYLPGSGWQQDGTYSSYLFPQTPMVYDIAAIQALYGADTITRTGNTEYGFNCSFAATDPERQIYDFSINKTPIFTIWDAGGTDTLNCSGYSGNQIISLIPGSYSSVDGMIQNVAIAFNCAIEGAVGGGGADTIIGSDGNNILAGGAGADSINGGNGSDIYMIYISDEHPAAERIADTGTAGIDEVRFASLKVQDTLVLTALDTGIEKVVIGTGTVPVAVTTGTTALNVNAYGVMNALSITGNAGANTLTGTAYGDTLTGGAGADKFVFNSIPVLPVNKDTITDFKHSLDVLQFSKSVFTAITSLAGSTLNPAEFWSGAGVTSGHDANDRIVYNSTAGNLYYDADGSGSGAAVLVALIGTTTHASITSTDIQIIA
ncbi:MAG: hypothetical protein FDX18_09530 [Chlorobium sp.]|nr:MAG: hypothetical protein FDX18_09530 [Chlorobium sp.]